MIVVVTRYFGGTKLGVGGLVRAYSDAALLILERSGKVTKYKTTLLEASFPYSHISGVMHVVSRVGAKIVDTMDDEDVHAVLEIRLAKAEELKAALVNKTRGNFALKIHHQ